MRAPSMSTISNENAFHSIFRLFRGYARAGRDQSADGVVGIGGEVVLDAECGEVRQERALPSRRARFRRPVGQYRREEALRGGGSSPTRASKISFRVMIPRVTPNSSQMIPYPKLFVAEVVRGAFVDFRTPRGKTFRGNQFAYIRKPGVGEMEEEVLEIDHAEDFVEASVADRIAVVRRLCDDFVNLFGVIETSIHAISLRWVMIDSTVRSRARIRVRRFAVRPPGLRRPRPPPG